MEEPYAPQNKLEELVVTIVRAFFIGLKTTAPYTKEIYPQCWPARAQCRISENLFAAGLSTAQSLCGNVIMQKLLGKTRWVASSVLRGVSHGMSVMVEEPQFRSSGIASPFSFFFCINWFVSFLILYSYYSYPLI